MRGGDKGVNKQMTYCQNLNVVALVLQIATETLQSGLDLRARVKERERARRKRRRKKIIIVSMIKMNQQENNPLDMQSLYKQTTGLALQLQPSLFNV